MIQKIDTITLRNKILDVAFKGKLVKQDPNDEPASVLLERIKKEKTQLIKEGKLKRDKNESIIYRGDDNHYYEKMGDSITDITEIIPFSIPHNWNWIRASELFMFRLGATPSRDIKKYWVGNIPWMSIGDIVNLGHTTKTKEKISQEAKEKYFAHRFCTAGTLIMSFKLTIGSTSIVDMDCAHNEAIISVLPYFDSNNILRNFLFYGLGLLTNYVKMTAAVKGSTLNSKIISSMFVPLPPLAEQQRIVEKIELLFAEIDKIEKAQNELDKLKEQTRQKVLDLAVRGQLVKQDPNDEPASVLLEKIDKEKKQLIKEGKIKRDKNESIIYRGDDKNYYEKIGNTITNITDEIPFEIPSNWSFARVQNICQTYTGNSINAEEKQKKYTNLSDGYNYIGTKDVEFDQTIHYENGIKIPYDTDFRIAHKGSALMCIEGGSAGRKIGILNQDVCFGNKLCAFEPFCIDNKFIYYYLQSPALVTLFRSQLSGIIGGVSADKLKRLLFTLPPLAEQRRIVEKLELLFSLL